MSEYSPAPWRTWDCISERGSDEYPEARKGDVRLVASNDLCLGVIWAGHQSMPELEHNAALIIRAVNSHEAMVDVLVDVWFHLSDTTDPTLRKIADNARAALDKAAILSRDCKPAQDRT